MDYFSIIQQLNACHGPSGDESEVAQTLLSLIKPYIDDYRFDIMGNLIAHKKGSGPKIMFSAHMDSIGLIVTHIDENGYVRFGKLGDLSLKSILHTPVRFRNGVCAVISRSHTPSKKEWSTEDFYLDIGAKDEAEAKRMVQIGDTAVSCLPVLHAGSHLISPYLDNRISCAALLQALTLIEAYENDLYFVFTVQKELGMRGAKTAAYAIDPDYGIAVDVTPADELDSRYSGSTVLGGGAAIKVMDHSVLSHPQVVERLSNLAITHHIPHQRDVLTGGSSDAGMIHISRGGVLTGGISVPCRYMHTSTEMVESKDVQACAELVAAFAASKL